MDLPSTVCKQYPYHCGCYRDDQIDDLLNIFFAVIDGVSWKSDLGIGEGNEKKENTSTDAYRKKMGTSISYGSLGRFFDLHVAGWTIVVRAGSFNIELKHTQHLRDLRRLYLL